MNLQEALFSGWSGCSNGDCVVRDNSKGMHTNASCKCVVEANRAQLYVLQSRLNRLVRQPEPDVSELVELLKQHHECAKSVKYSKTEAINTVCGFLYTKTDLHDKTVAALAKHGGAA